MAVMTSVEPLLAIRDLSVGLRSRSGVTPLVRGVSLDVRPGERVGLVGESGSGKSLTLLAAMGLLAGSPVEVTGGSVRLGGTELVGAPDRVLRGYRGSQIAMIYQDPMTSLDPVQRVGAQIAEGLRAHGASRRSAWERTLAVLAEVQLPDPARLARAYPHELSGGMRQRVMIATALALDPSVVIMDEPTTALDVVTQREILEELMALRDRLGFAVLFISHDLSLLVEIADSIAVMYAGRLVERAGASAVFRAPRHPYSLGLLSSFPALHGPRQAMEGIPGSPPDLRDMPSGCPFHPRCGYAFDRCRSDPPPPLLELDAGTRAAACWLQDGREAVPAELALTAVDAVSANSGGRA